jgi:uncharacterized protein YbjT (DUF2867 family)
MRTTENAYTQHLDGLISDAHLASSKASAKAFLTSPGCRALWLAIRRNREAGFRHFMDGLLEEANELPPSDLFASWKSHLRDTTVT